MTPKQRPLPAKDGTRDDVKARPAGTTSAIALPDHPIETDLDPKDWDAFARSAHAALDEALTFIRDVRDRPVWQQVPEDVKIALKDGPPADPMSVTDVYAQYQTLIQPYATGNIHPLFLGWVHGSGTPTGIITEMLSASMNANVGGRDHGAVYVERQVLDWCREIFNFPPGASGLLVSGTSMATLIALSVARNNAPNRSRTKQNRDVGTADASELNVRKQGIAAIKAPLVAYTSKQAHSSIAKAMELLGLGSEALRLIETDELKALSPDALRTAIAADKAAGAIPFCVIATAGTVNTGALDPIDTLADICASEGLWLHVDGAFGSLAILSEQLAPLVKGIERADSLAFDFHKWLHVPYDAGCVMIRDGKLHQQAFSSRPDYLARKTQGLSGGDPWFCEFGPELSRGFRALKIWFTLKEHGTKRLAAQIEQNCAQARYLADLIDSSPCLELLSPVTLNIVCFRFRDGALSNAVLDRLNDTIVTDLQNKGIAVPSTTRLDGALAIRVNLTNHRTRRADLDVLVAAIIGLGKDRLAVHADPTAAQ